MHHHLHLDRTGASHLLHRWPISSNTLHSNHLSSSNSSSSNSPLSFLNNNLPNFRIQVFQTLAHLEHLYLGPRAAPINPSVCIHRVWTLLSRIRRLVEGSHPPMSQGSLLLLPA